MTLNEFITNPYFTFSGWLFGLLSLIVAIVQYKQKNEYKFKFNQLNKQIGSTNSNIISNDQSTAVSNNNGTIKIRHK